MKLFLIIVAAIITAVLLLIVGCGVLATAGAESVNRTAEKEMKEAYGEAITREQYDFITVAGQSQANVEALLPVSPMNDDETDAFMSKAYASMGVSGCLHYRIESETAPLAAAQFCFADDRLVSKNVY